MGTLLSSKIMEKRIHSKTKCYLCMRMEVCRDVSYEQICNSCARRAACKLQTKCRCQKMYLSTLHRPRSLSQFVCQVHWCMFKQRTTLLSQELTSLAKLKNEILQCICSTDLTHKMLNRNWTTPLQIISCTLNFPSWFNSRIFSFVQQESIFLWW